MLNWHCTGSILSVDFNVCIGEYSKTSKLENVNILLIIPLEQRLIQASNMPLTTTMNFFSWSFKITQTAILIRISGNDNIQAYPRYDCDLLPFKVFHVLRVELSWNNWWFSNLALGTHNHLWKKKGRVIE